MMIRVRYDWGPNGAGRFLQLVDMGFFTNMTFFRVPPLQSNPIAQFGVSPLRSVRSKLLSLPSLLDDSPSVPCKKGYFGFGGSGANSRTHHMWVARETFSRIHPSLGQAVWEVPFAEMISGLDVLDRIHGVGDMKPWGDGPDTGRMLSDPTFETEFPGEYLRRNFPAVDWFLGCTHL